MAPNLSVAPYFDGYQASSALMFTEQHNANIRYSEKIPVKG